MSRWSHGNTPTFTFADLLTMVQESVGNDIDTAIVTDAVTDSLHALSSVLRNLFYVDVPATCTHQCEVDLTELGITDITNVQYKMPGCIGATCWRDLSWWQVVGTQLLTQLLPRGAVLRIEFVEPAGVWLTLDGGDAQVSEAWDSSSGNTDLKITVSDNVKLEPARFPAAGYFHGFDNKVLEYVGRTEEDGVITLHNVSVPGMVKGNVTLAADSSIYFAIQIRDMRMLDVMRARARNLHWSRKLLTCVSNEDRSFASQMMVFYAGEKEKALKEVSRMRPRNTPRLRLKGTDRVMAGCCQ